MPAPILAGIGKVVMGVVAGTAKGLAAGARVASTTAKSSGKLVQSASNIRTNIVKSNKRIKKIKLNRRRINKSIFNEKKRKQREKGLESKSKRESGLGGLLASPLAVAGGIKKFIYTLLFGLAISNIEKIKKFFDTIGDGFTRFGQFIIGVVNSMKSLFTMFGKDESEMKSKTKNIESDLDKIKKAFDIPIFDSVIRQADIETGDWRKKLNMAAFENEPNFADRKEKFLNEVAEIEIPEEARSNLGGRFMNAKEEEAHELAKLDARFHQFAPPISFNLLPGGGYWKRIAHWQELEKLKEKKRKEIRSKWKNGNPYLQSKGVDNSRLNTLNSDSVGSENTVIINQPIIKKEYVPVPYN